MARSIKIIIIFLIFLIFIFFRFYNLNQRLGFDWDQEHYSYQVKNIIQNHKLTLIGPRSNNEKGFFLGPYFIYLLAPFYLITNLHPSALMYFVIFYNLLFFFIAFLILRKIFGYTLTALFLFLWLINNLLVNYDTVPWNPILIPLGIIVVWKILYDIYKINSFSSWIILGFVSGLFLNIHFQFIFILIFSLLFIFFYSWKEKFKYWRELILMIFCFFMVFLPLLIFDLRHNFLNTHLFYNSFFGEKTIRGTDSKVWLSIFNNVLQPLVYFKQNSTTILFYLLLFVIILYLIKNRKNFLHYFYCCFLGIWLIFPIFFSFYGRRPSEYYFFFLYPFIFVTIIDFFLAIKKTGLLLIICLLELIINLNPLRTNLQSSKFSLYYKEKAIKKLKEIIKNNRKLNITYDMPLGLNNGYNYLIDYYQIKQSGDFKDPLIEIRVPPKENDIKIGEIGLKIPSILK
jgi:hypothetical protein